MRKIYRKLLLTIGGMVLMIIGALVGIAILGRGAATGTIVQRTPAAAAKAGASTLVLHGKYISLSYPSTYAVNDSQLGDTAALEQYRLIAATQYTKSATIIVTPLLAGGISADPGYRSRLLNPAGYAESTTSVNGMSVVEMSRQDGSERVAFLSHNNLECSIALTTGLTTGDNLATEMTAILHSFHWNK